MRKQIKESKRSSNRLPLLEVKNINEGRDMNGINVHAGMYGDVDQAFSDLQDRYTILRDRMEERYEKWQYLYDNYEDIVNDLTPILSHFSKVDVIFAMGDPDERPQFSISLGAGNAEKLISKNPELKQEIDDAIEDVRRSYDGLKWNWKSPYNFGTMYFTK